MIFGTGWDWRGHSNLIDFQTRGLNVPKRVFSIFLYVEHLFFKQFWWFLSLFSLQSSLDIRCQQILYGSYHFQNIKGLKWGQHPKISPILIEFFFLPSSNGFWDIMSQRELNDTNTEQFVSCMSQQICCSSYSFRDMIGSIVTNSQHFLFSF